MRILFSAALLLFFAGPVSLVHAQACNPTCPTGQNCVYVSSTDHTSVCSTGSVSELVVTATRKPKPTGPTFATAVQVIVAIANQAVIPLLYALAFLFFVGGLVRYFFLEQGDEGRQKGKDMSMYGLIGLVVIFSVWALVNVGLATLYSAIGG